jgi:predicted nuclease of predicted toxin-antitoxin system
MRGILVDECVGRKACRRLHKEYNGRVSISYVRDIMPGAPDGDVWLYSKKNNLIIVTNDNGFAKKDDLVVLVNKDNMAETFHKIEVLLD